MLYKGPDHHRFGDFAGGPGTNLLGIMVEENYGQLCSQRNEDLAYNRTKPCTWMHIVFSFENTGNTLKRPSAVSEWLNQLCIHIKEYYLIIKKGTTDTKQPEWISRNYAEWKNQSQKTVYCTTPLHNLLKWQNPINGEQARLWEVLWRGGSGKEVGVAVTETPSWSL